MREVHNSYIREMTLHEILEDKNCVCKRQVYKGNKSEEVFTFTLDLLSETQEYEVICIAIPRKVEES